MNFKDIHIGYLIKERVAETEISLSRICNFLKCNEEEIEKMYLEKSLNTEILVRWSKILEYDFFRIYSQHLILYAPASTGDKKTKNIKSTIPRFRKNIYTREIIDFILERVRSGAMSKSEITEKYRIPKTTLYKWISKYGK